ncbi:hypothetical protein F5146DRAFT_999246 [Armillaria mellea]|nr:hypothetical protein F5146DRAFT_999246 [Armillaria mellea]
MRFLRVSSIRGRLTLLACTRGNRTVTIGPAEREHSATREYQRLCGELSIAKGRRSEKSGTTADDRKLRTQLQLTRGFELQKVPIFATAFGNDFQGSRARSLSDPERLTLVLGAQEFPGRPKSGYLAWVLARKRVHWDDDIKQISLRPETYTPPPPPPPRPRRDAKSGTPLKAPGRLPHASSDYVATAYVSPVSSSHHTTEPPVASASSSFSDARRLRHDSPHTCLRALYSTRTQKRPKIVEDPYPHSHSSPQTSSTPYQDLVHLPASIGMHRALTVGTCEPIDFFSSKRVKPHASVASEFASDPPLPRLLLFAEIGSHGFNIEVRARDGVGVTVEDVLVRAQTVLRALLPPETLGGCYRQKCSCGIDVDRVSDFTTLFFGLSVGGGTMFYKDQAVWRMHLKRVRTM